MEIKFKVNAAELNEALGVVSIVTPLPVTPQGGTGYLFVVNGNICRVYSKNATQAARASFPIEDVVGEGAFMYPAQYVNALAYVEGPLYFTATETAGDTGNTYKVKFVQGSENASASSDKVTFDYHMTQAFEKDIPEAGAGNERKFNLGVLREALSMGKAFLADKTPEEHFKVIQIFGNQDPALAAKANGYMFASNSVEAFFFHSPALVDNNLVVPGKHLSNLESFIAKSTGKELRAYPTDTDGMTYVKNERDHVFGWGRHTDQYKQFSYYTKTADQFVFELGREEMLHQLQYIRAELEKSRDKIRFEYSAAAETVKFSIISETSSTTSLPIKIRKVVASPGQDLSANVNVEHMIDMFQGVKGSPVEFRVYHTPPSATHAKDRFMFRTIDEFWLDDTGKVVGGSGLKDVPGAFVCRVTRFAPGKD